MKHEDNLYACRMKARMKTPKHASTLVSEVAAEVGRTLAAVNWLQ